MYDLSINKSCLKRALKLKDCSEYIAILTVFKGKEKLDKERFVAYDKLSGQSKN